MWKKIKYIVRRKLNRSIGQWEINMEQLNKKMTEGAILLDVRSNQEYNEGHLDKAISIPKYELRSRVEKEILDKKIPIIVYCSNGYRSKRARKELIEMGYEQVYNLYNGIENY